MAISWDEFKEEALDAVKKPWLTVGEAKKWAEALNKDYYFQAPKMGDHPHYYSVKIGKNGKPYTESVEYDTIQFRLFWEESFKYDTRTYTLEWLQDGKKYTCTLDIDLYTLSHAPLDDPQELAYLLAEKFRYEMEGFGCSPAQIQSMYDFLGKLAWGEMQSSGKHISDMYAYTHYSTGKKFAKGGIVMHSGGIKGPGFEIGPGQFYVDEFGSVNGGGGGWGGNYRQPEVDLLPGIKEKVKHPVTGEQNTVEKIIIDLNDVHMWTRDQIADWLETLDVDLTFKEEPAKLDKQKVKLPPELPVSDIKPIAQKPGTYSIQVDMGKLDQKTLEILYGKAISKEQFEKEIGGTE